MPEWLRLLLFLVSNGIYLLIVLISIPLYYEKIKPNNFYGLRIKATLENEKVWYPANKYSAVLSFYFFLIHLVISIPVYFLIKNGLVYVISETILMMLLLIVYVVLAIKKAGNIAKELKQKK